LTKSNRICASVSRGDLWPRKERGMERRKARFEGQGVRCEGRWRAACATPFAARAGQFPAPSQASGHSQPATRHCLLLDTTSRVESHVNHSKQKMQVRATRHSRTAVAGCGVRELAPAFSSTGLAPAVLLGPRLQHARASPSGKQRRRAAALHNTLAHTPHVGCAIFLLWYAVCLKQCPDAPANLKLKLGHRRRGRAIGGGPSELLQCARGMQSCWP